MLPSFQDGLGLPARVACPARAVSSSLALPHTSASADNNRLRQAGRNALLSVRIVLPRPSRVSGIRVFVALQ